jgi:hypothetical protein
MAVHQDPKVLLVAAILKEEIAIRPDYMSSRGMSAVPRLLFP